MRGSIWISAGFVAAALCAAALPASADNASAYCEVRKDGETRHGRSGPCDFSQRQGYVTIDLRNGETWELSPGERPDHFRHQKGNKVVRNAGGAAGSPTITLPGRRRTPPCACPTRPSS